MVETTAWEGDLAKENADGLRPGEAFAKTERLKTQQAAKASTQTY